MMLPVEDLRAKLLTQRRDLFRQAAQTERICCGSRRMWNVKRWSEDRRKLWCGCSVGWMNAKREKLNPSTSLSRELKPVRMDVAGAAAKTSRWPAAGCAHCDDFSDLRRGS
jgi:hypothetical protein